MLIYLVRYLLCVMIFALMPVKILSQPVNKNDDSRIVVDQRQSGKYNIHLSIKDVAIIEMDRNDFQDNTVNDDYYYYDEGDLTVKPISAWFTSSTTAKTTTFNTTLPAEIDTGSGSSESGSIVTLSGEEENLTTIHLPIQSSPKPINISVKPDQYQFPSSTTTRPPITTSKKTNVVILDPSSTFLPPLENKVTTHSLPLYNQSVSHLSQPTPPIDVQSMQAIFEPVLRPKQRATSKHSFLNQHMRFRPAVRVMPPLSSSEPQSDDSRIFNFKARRSSPNSFRGRCRQGHYRDVDGNCRVKRSSSIL